jgi:hypothetical protein
MKKKIVFIICNGRSGSTVLSKFLGSNSNSFAFSEPHYFDTHYNDEEICSCEKPYLNCSFWNKVVDSMQLKPNDIANFNTSSIPFFKNKENKITKFIKYISLLLFYKFKMPYIDQSYFNQIKNEALLLETAINLRSETVFIDASKSLIRAIFIMGTFRTKFDYSFLFLERDARSIISSMKKNTKDIKFSNGKNDNITINEAFDIHSAINQVKSIKKNISILSRVFGIKGTHIVYESFTENTKEVFQSFCSKININWEENMLDLDNSDHHLLGGNYSRVFAKKIKKAKKEWFILTDNELREINKNIK